MTYSENVNGTFFGWDTVQKMMGRYRFLNLFGPPGCGKTYTAWKWGIDKFGPDRVARIMFNDDKTVPECLGHYIQGGGNDGFIWNYLSMVPIYRDGGLVIGDELKRASSPVQDALLEILEDDDGISSLTLTSGEVIKRHKDFRFIATHNDGPEFMDSALRDRFKVHLYIGEPHPDALKKIGRDEIRQFTQNVYRNGGDADFSFRTLRTYDEMLSAGDDAETASRMLFGPRGEELVNALSIGPRETVEDDDA